MRRTRASHNHKDWGWCIKGPARLRLWFWLWLILPHGAWAAEDYEDVSVIYREPLQNSPDGGTSATGHVGISYRDPQTGEVWVIEHVPQEWGNADDEIRWVPLADFGEYAAQVPIGTAFPGIDTNGIIDYAKGEVGPRNWDLAGANCTHWCVEAINFGGGQFPAPLDFMDWALFPTPWDLVTELAELGMLNLSFPPQGEEPSTIRPPNVGPDNVDPDVPPPPDDGGGGGAGGIESFPAYYRPQVRKMALATKSDPDGTLSLRPHLPEPPPGMTGRYVTHDYGPFGADFAEELFFVQEDRVVGSVLLVAVRDGVYLHDPVICRRFHGYDMVHTRPASKAGPLYWYSLFTHPADPAVVEHNLKFLVEAPVNPDVPLRVMSRWRPELYPQPDPGSVTYAVQVRASSTFLLNQLFANLRAGLAAFRPLDEVDREIPAMPAALIRRARFDARSGRAELTLFGLDEIPTHVEVTADTFYSKTLTTLRTLEFPNQALAPDQTVTLDLGLAVDVMVHIHGGGVHESAYLAGGALMAVSDADSGGGSVVASSYECELEWLEVAPDRLPLPGCIRLQGTLGDGLAVPWAGAFRELTKSALPVALEPSLTHLSFRARSTPPRIYVAKLESPSGVHFRHPFEVPEPWATIQLPLRDFVAPNGGPDGAPLPYDGRPVKVISWFAEGPAGADFELAIERVQVVPPRCDLLDEGALCDDGNACTDRDACTDGLCLGEAIQCGDDDVCTDDLCDEQMGCIYPPNTAPCDDASACTDGDGCQEGVCAGTPIVCGDENPCTDDRCDPQSGCMFPFNTAPCDDASACTDGDGCQEGVCAGAPIVCGDENPCTDDRCDPQSGCMFPFNTAPCDDASACTDGDGCQEGVCAGTPIICGDENPCTDDRCDPQSGCIFPFNTAPCDDASACTDGDECQEGVCVGAPIVCGDENTCTDDRCDPQAGCIFPFNTAPCDDASACTDGDQCEEGACVGAPVVCGDENPCTDDRCDPQSGCMFPFNTAPCDDASACTDGDRCENGRCAGQLIRCEDDLACTLDNCDPERGCVHDAGPCLCDDDADCEDGDPCSDAVCVEGACELLDEPEMLGCCRGHDDCLPAAERCDHETHRCEPAQCAPCTHREDCGAPENRCVDMPSGQYCAITCQLDEDCDGPATCEDVGGGSWLCLAAAGDCACEDPITQMACEGGNVMRIVSCANAELSTRDRVQHCEERGCLNGACCPEDTVLIDDECTFEPPPGRPDAAVVPPPDNDGGRDALPDTRPASPTDAALDTRPAPPSDDSGGIRDVVDAHPDASTPPAADSDVLRRDVAVADGGDFDPDSTTDEGSGGGGCTTYCHTAHDSNGLWLLALLLLLGLRRGRSRRCVPRGTGGVERGVSTAAGYRAKPVDSSEPPRRP